MVLGVRAPQKGQWWGILDVGLGKGLRRAARPVYQDDGVVLRIVLLDHELYRMGLRLVLECWSDCEVVGEASSARDAFGLIRGLAPDVVVLDHVLPGLRGASGIRKIRRWAPGVRVLILTELARSPDVAAALLAGARGYAVKGDSNEEIVRAIRRVHEGRLYLAPGVDPRDLGLGAAPVTTSPDMVG